jgi:hypothetical protein
MTEVRATFQSLASAHVAQGRLTAAGALEEDIRTEAGDIAFVEASAREARTMGRIVVVIVLASIVGTVIGILIGASLHLLVGPGGTSGLIIQVVSWAIFAHLLIGMLAGYFLLADRTEREIGRGRPVILVIQCANIDADTVLKALHGTGASDLT